MEYRKATIGRFMMNEERLRSLEDSMLLIRKDIEAVNKNLTDLNASLAIVSKIKTEYTALKIKTDSLAERLNILSENLNWLQNAIADINVNNEFVTKVRGMLWKIATAAILLLLGAGSYIIKG